MNRHKLAALALGLTLALAGAPATAHVLPGDPAGLHHGPGLPTVVFGCILVVLAVLAVVLWVRARKSSD